MDNSFFFFFFENNLNSRIRCNTGTWNAYASEAYSKLKWDTHYAKLSKTSITNLLGKHPMPC